jgi:hypothetical protein
VNKKERGEQKIWHEAVKHEKTVMDGNFHGELSTFRNDDAGDGGGVCVCVDQVN